jgi:hypothetical protein
LRSASHRLLPRSLLPFVAPKPLTVPLCWSPFIASTFLQSSARRHRSASSGSPSRVSDSTSLLAPLPPATRPLVPCARVGGGLVSTEVHLSGAPVVFSDE